MSEVALPSPWGSFGFGKPAAETKSKAFKKQKHKKTKGTSIEKGLTEEPPPEVEESSAIEAPAEEVPTRIQVREWGGYEA